jgi:hypothetical protein
MKCTVSHICLLDGAQILGTFVLLYLGVLFSTFGQVKIPHRGGVS